jgi:hypothetical protein
MKRFQTLLSIPACAATSRTRNTWTLHWRCAWSVTAESARSLLSVWDSEIELVDTAQFSNVGQDVYVQMLYKSHCGTN